MTNIIYKKREFEIEEIEASPISFGGGLEIIDDALKMISKDNEVFFIDNETGIIYEEKQCNR